MDIMCYTVSISYTDGTKTIATFDNQDFMGKWLSCKDMGIVDELTVTPERI